MYTFRIALRYLFSKKSHNAVNVISVVSLLGVAVATVAIVCVLSVFNGFTDIALSRLSKVDPALRVVPSGSRLIPGADSIAALLGELPEIASALPTLEEHALAMYNGSQTAVDIIGVPAGYAGVVDLTPSVIDGDFITAEHDVAVATLSVGPAMRLKAFPGGSHLLALYVPKRLGRINTANPMASFRTDSLFVGGVVRIEDNDRDASTVYIPLETARDLLEYSGGEATSIEMAVAPGYSESQAAEAAERLLGHGFTVKDRLRQEAQSFKMIAIEKWITFSMLAFILLIASFNVISTLSMLIIEKKDNLATLRSLGATTGSLRRIFLWEGWLISALGGVAGLIAGTVLCLAQQTWGFVKLNGDPSELIINAYPVRVNIADLFVVFALVLVIGFVVGFVTSRFVGRK